MLQINYSQLEYSITNTQIRDGIENEIFCNDLAGDRPRDEQEMATLWTPMGKLGDTPLLRCHVVKSSIADALKKDHIKSTNQRETYIKALLLVE